MTVASATSPDAAGSFGALARSEQAQAPSSAAGIDAAPIAAAESTTTHADDKGALLTIGWVTALVGGAGGVLAIVLIPYLRKRNGGGNKSK